LDAWFDADCSDAKRLTRRLERAYSAAVQRSPQQLQDTLRQHKRRAYRVELVETNRDSPKCQWRTVDQLLGRGRLPVNTAVTAEYLSRYFEQKVAAVQAATAGATAPVFTAPDHPGT